MLLALYPRDALADDIGLPDQRGVPPPGWKGFTIAHNVATRADVDSALREAETAGAHIVKRAAETFWGGYSGYFADPDGFHWEVATGSGLPTEPGPT